MDSWSSSLSLLPSADRVSRGLEAFCFTTAVEPGAWEAPSPGTFPRGEIGFSAAGAGSSCGFSFKELEVLGAFDGTGAMASIPFGTIRRPSVPAFGRTLAVAAGSVLLPSTLAGPEPPDKDSAEIIEVFEPKRTVAGIGNAGATRVCEPV